LDGYQNVEQKIQLALLDFLLGATDEELGPLALVCVDVISSSVSSPPAFD